MSLITKQIIDFFLALLLLLIVSPIILIIVITLWVTKQQIFFLQQRPGKNGTIFTIIKFATMNNKTNDHGELLSDYARTTPLGAFLRKTSLDELPQLINILKGEMSFVGPRPLLPEYLPLYSPEQSRRHNVKPGITGWAQINGRNTLNWEDKFLLDIWYVDNQSLFLDAKILFLTLHRVLFKTNQVNSNTTNTMDKFKGSNTDEHS